MANLDEKVQRVKWWQLLWRGQLIWCCECKALKISWLPIPGSKVQGVRSYRCSPSCLLDALAAWMDRRGLLG